MSRKLPGAKGGKLYRRCQRQLGACAVIGKQEESSEALRSREDCGIVSVVALETEPE
jgi:hypothetical protein